MRSALKNKEQLRYPRHWQTRCRCFPMAVGSIATCTFQEGGIECDELPPFTTPPFFSPNPHDISISSTSILREISMTEIPGFRSRYRCGHRDSSRDIDPTGWRRAGARSIVRTSAHDGTSHTTGCEAKEGRCEPDPSQIQGGREDDRAAGLSTR